ncbi:MAG: endonuclease III [Nitrospirae bacterium]|nr:endonuclease III [Nitrospirota bacterium]
MRTGKSTPSPAKAKAAPVGELLTGLRERWPEASCTLHHSSALELLIATILSAQCTDERVNRLTPVLFKKYPSAEAWVRADLAAIEHDIRSSGFFRNKARSIQGACRMIVQECGGRVPDTMEELIRLPGVARKTANVLLGTWFKKSEGIVVDTHVHRLVQRWGLSGEADPVKVERDLMERVERKDWTYFGHATILHGRHVCQARKPLCGECNLASFCPSCQPALAGFTP